MQKFQADAEVEATIGQTIRKIGGHTRSYYIQDKIKYFEIHCNVITIF